MAQRRMFNQSITSSDLFLDMPATTQNLYFHLNMEADDDGFVNSPNKVMRMIGASKNDMDLLLTKQYVFVFESGVVVIKHWKIHNYIQKDRYKPTIHVMEKNQIKQDESKAYTKCIHDVRLGKVRLDKSSIDKISKEYISELQKIFKNYYSSISSRFITKKVKNELERKLLDYDFEVIKNGFENYLKEKQKEKTEITFVKSTHLFLKDEMFNDYQDQQFESKSTNPNTKRMSAAEFLGSSDNDE